MTHEEFHRTMNQRLEEVSVILSKKQHEYAPDEDRLIQFRKASWILGTSPLKALAGMMSKHTTSIYMMLQEPSSYSREMWTEKITDHIAYLVLLEALLKDILWSYERDGEE